MHAGSSCHVPVESHVWGFCPLHCFAPGLHVPEQAPPLQTFMQSASLCQAPFVSHCCGVSPLHCRASGSQTPEHAPDTHA